MEKLKNDDNNINRGETSKTTTKDAESKSKEDAKDVKGAQSDGSLESENDSEVTGTESEYSDIWEEYSESDHEGPVLPSFRPCQIRDEFIHDEAKICNNESSEENFSSSEIEGLADGSDCEIGRKRKSKRNIIIINDEGWNDITTSEVEFPYFSENFVLDPNFNKETIKTPLDSYKVFITDEIVNLISKQTNRFVGQKVIARELKFLDNWVDTDPNEIRQFLAILISMQLCSLSDTHSYWDEDPFFGHNLISSYMCGNRFHELINFVHFEIGDKIDKTSARNRLKKFEPITTMLVERYQKVFKPGRDLVIFEDIYTLNRALKIKTLTDTVRFHRICDKNGYTFNVNLQQGVGGTYKNLEISCRVIRKLLEFVEPKQGRILYADFNNTTEKLVRDLYKLKMYCCGTIYRNRMLPEDFQKPSKFRETVGKEKDKVRIIKFTDKFPNGDELLITSVPAHDTELIKIKRNRNSEKFTLKPKCIIDYDKSRREIEKLREQVDITDRTFFHIKWYRKILIELLTGTTLINSYILYNTVAEEKLDFTKYRQKLIKQLGKFYKRCNCVQWVDEDEVEEAEINGENVHKRKMG